MTDGLPIIERMEAALTRMLAAAEPPSAEVTEASRLAALPSLDEVLSPAAARLAEAEIQVQTTDRLLESATQGLSAWRSRLAVLGRRLEAGAGRAVS